MAIKVLGSEFNDWVQKQINQRQTINALSTFKDKNTILYQNVNDSFIRLTSAVDVNLTNTDAYNFQLFSTRFGGVGSDGEFASGVGAKVNSTYAYGFQSDGSYGFSPPPGITSADIKALNQGSFKEATVDILAHNMAQFEIIERLYLRVGYTVLLEWGHNMYFNNNGEFESSNPHEVYTAFLNGNSSQLDIQNKILTERSSSNGNYDAMHGMVRNFDWNLEKDGSYKITVNIASVGDVFESLKANTAHPVTDASKASTQNIPEDQPPLQFNSQKTTINKILWYLTEQLKPSDMKTDGSHKFYLQGNETTAELISAGTGLKANQYNNSPLGSQGDVVGFLFPQLNGVNTGRAGYNAQYFIKLGVLLRCIQNFSLLYNPDKNNEALININTNEEENFCFTYPRQGSLDPRVCLVDISKDVTLDTFSLTGTSSLPPNNFNINDTYYEFKTVKVEESTTSNPFVTESDKVYGSESSSDGLDIDSYVEDIENPTTKEYLNKFLQDNLGSTTTVVTKTGPVLSGTLTSLDNYPVRSNSKFGIDLLNKFSSLGLDEANNFQSEFVEKFADYQTIEYKTPAIEGELYLTKVWDQVNQVTSDPSKGKHARGSSTKYLVVTTITITTYRVTVSSLVKTTTGYTGANVEKENEEDVDVSNNLFDQIRNGSKFRVDHCNYPFIGRTMNIYINMNHAASILQNNVDITSGAISMYEFLNTLMKDVQRALGNLNNFYIPYDENANEFSIVDKTTIPQLGKYLLETKGYNPFNTNPVKFLTNTLGSTGGSFVREASFKTQISNNFMSQVTIGAQANGNVVGMNATLLSTLNKGLTDRIFFEKTSENNKSDTTPDTIISNFVSNVGIVQNLYNAINDGNITDQQIDGAIDVGVDLFNYEVGTYVKEGYIPGIGLLPINLEITLDGLSGMNIGETYTTDTKLLPNIYQKATQFIITGISHKIQNNDWTTTIQSISGPKYDGVTVVLPPTPKTTTVKIIKDPRFKPSNNPNLSSTKRSSITTGIALLEPGFKEAVAALEDKIGVERDALLRIMKHESGLDPAAVNKSTNATGLIQFLPSTAIGLGTTVEALKTMTGVQQLNYVEKYFTPVFGKAKVIGDLYMHTFLPAFVDKPNNFELARKDSTDILYDKISKGTIYKKNPGFDTSKKGYYTVGDVRVYISQYY